MIKIKQRHRDIFGTVVVLIVVSLGIGQAVIKAVAQRAAVQGYVLKAGEGERLVLRGADIFINVAPSKGSDGLAIGTQQVPVGGGIPTHRHAEMDEVFYVAEGNGTAILNDVRLPFEKGATIFIPKGTWHAIETGSKELLLLWAVAPPGLEAYFRERASRPGEPEKQLNLQQLNDIARKYGGTEFR
jgi:mannose-6-phosphate isomerase-like protein (cupin superfamily)